jgi:hypothetical protein
MQYATLIESDKPTGYYAKFDKSQAYRVENVDKFQWAFGAERPQGDFNLASHNWVPFAVKRWQYSVDLAEEQVANADWDVKLKYTHQIANQLMVARTKRSVTAITTTSNWATTADEEMSANHYDTATNIGGGKLDVGTSTVPYLRKALDSAADLIQLDTGGAVQHDQLFVVMNPTDAKRISASAEMHDYLKGSPDARDEITGANGPNAKYGYRLPTKLYGYNVVVENASIVTNVKGATLARSYIWPTGTIGIMARVGSLQSSINTPNFSTYGIVWYKDEMTVEEFHDVKNRRFTYAVSEATAEILLSPVSGYLITSATG